ncbi:MAG: transposase [Candidatus Bipolaricaulota bacterium]|nr:transposase [Candidatus Bipolaricaulota bacterium]
MSMGRREANQGSMWIAQSDIQRGAGHRFYEKLNELLREAGFDRKVEALCASYFEADHTPGRKSIAPGVYFRMHLIGYFEGIESERGIEWRCADSLSLRDFLGLELTERVPDHSTLSRMRMRLPLEVHQQAFVLILGIVERKGLLRGRVSGVDSTFLRADASMKTIVRRDTKESYPQFVQRLAEESGMENPTEEEARRFDRSRTEKRTSNEEWESRTDSEARIAKLKDGRTRLAYKSEHVVDLETGALVGVSVHKADCADTETLPETLADAEENLRGARNVGSEKSKDDDCDGDRTAGDASSGEAKDAQRAVVADKGYNKAVLLRQLKEKGYRTYIPERRQAGKRRWTDKGGRDTAAAFYDNRARVKRKKGRGLQRKRGELLERTFAHICETGGARRTRLRGRENVRKRYLLQASAANLGLVMRSLFGRGTPRGLAELLPMCTRVSLRITAALQAGANALLRALFQTFHLIRAPRSTVDLTRAFANAGEVA